MPTTKVRAASLWKVVRSLTLSGTFQKDLAGAPTKPKSRDFTEFTGQATVMPCACLPVNICLMKVCVQQDWPASYVSSKPQPHFSRPEELRMTKLDKDNSQ